MGMGMTWARWTLLAIIALACACIAPSFAIAQTCDEPCTQFVPLSSLLSPKLSVRIATMKMANEAISIGDMFEMQTLMNNLSQQQETSSGVAPSSNSTINSMGRNIRGFADEPKSEIESRTDEAFSALGYADGNNKAPTFNKVPPLPDREWITWVNLGGAGFKVNDTSGTGNDAKGNQVSVAAGLGRKLAPDTLVGLVVGYDHFKYDVPALAGSLKNDGATISGYFGQRFGDLRFDAAFGWTNLNYSSTVGTDSGSFIGSRWLASAGLTGNYKLNGFVLKPSASVINIWEHDRAFTDSLGNGIAANNFSAGRAAFGAKIERPFAVSGGWAFSPYAGLYGDWLFSSSNALPVGLPVAFIKDGWSGRVTAGLAANARGTMLSLGGELDGLGASYKIWMGNLRITMLF
jgi:autotransporter-like protein/uncharacterized protein DUF5407